MPASKCPEGARPLAWYQQNGFGEQAVWFRDAVIYVPPEGAASITPRELVAGAADTLTPMHVASEPAADCPETARWNAKIDSNRLSAVSGRGKMRDDGTFAIELERPFGPFKHMAALPVCAIYPREAVEHYGKTFYYHPVGSGAFEFGDRFGVAAGDREHLGKLVMNGAGVG